MNPPDARHIFHLDTLSRQVQSDPPPVLTVRYGRQCWPARTKGMCRVGISRWRLGYKGSVPVELRGREDGGVRGVCQWGTVSG